MVKATAARDRVAVIGVGQTKFGEQWELSIRRITLTAATACLADSGVRGADIDGLYVSNTSTSSFMKQDHQAAMAADSGGLLPIPSTEVEAACASGGVAVRHAYMAIKSGEHKVIMVMVTMVLWVRALFAVRESSQQSSVTTNASALIGWACVFAAVLLLLDLAFRPFYSHVFSPAEFFIYFVLALFVEPATLLIVRLLYRVRRGTTERPTERQHGQRSTSKAAGYALQWIRR